MYRYISVVFLISAVLLFLFSATVFATPAGDNIIITEVQYDADNTVGAENGGEWFELYNPTDSTIDIGGWTIEELSGDVYTFPSPTNIVSGGYLLAVNDTVEFNLEHVGVVPDLDMDGPGCHSAVDCLQLNNSGTDQLTLRDGAVGVGTTIDFVSWESAADYASSGPGETICRDTSVDTDSAVGWLDDCTPSPGTGTYTVIVNTAPGGVGTDLELWLKADDGPVGSPTVTSWEDRSLDGNNTTGAGDPQLIDNHTNFNPAVDFDGTDSFTDADGVFGAVNRANLSIYTVHAQDDVTQSDGALRHLTSSALIRVTHSNINRLIADVESNGGTNRLEVTPISQAYVSGEFNINTFRHEGGVSQSFYRNSELLASDATATATYNAGNGELTIGSPGTESMDGKVNEVIAYSDAHTTDERLQIESYLALKYGITLDSAVGTYKDSSGADVYDLSSYENYIIGLARDDASTLDQRISKSEEMGSVLTITTDDASADFTGVNGGARTQMADGEYVVLGSDNGAITSAATGITGYDNKIARQWKAEVTNYTGDLNVKFDIPAITGTDWDLVQSDTSDFTAGGANLTKVADLDTNGEALDVTLTDGKFYGVMESGIVSLSISGQLLDSEGGTGLNGLTIALLLDGGSKVTTTTANNAAGGGLDGEYEFTGIDLSSTTVVSVYVDDETENGITVTLDNDASITGLDIIEDYVTLQHENAGPISNVSFATANNGDVDISTLYSIDVSDNLSTTTGTSLLVPVTYTYTPGANLDLAGDLHVDGTIAAAAVTMNIAGDVEVTGTYTDTASVIILDGATAQTFDHNVVTTNADLTIANTAAPVTLAANTRVDTLTIPVNAILDLAGFDIEASTSFSNDGTVRFIGEEGTGITQDIDSGTWEVVGDGGFFHGLADFGAVDYYNLTFNDVTPADDLFFLFDNLTVANNLTITSGEVDFSGGNTIDVNGDYILGAGATHIVDDSTLTIAGDFTNNATAFTTGTGTITLDGDNQTVTGDTDFTTLIKNAQAGGSVLTFADDTDITIATALTLDGAAGDILVIASDSAAPLSRPTITMTGGSVFTGDFLDIENNTIVDASTAFTTPVNPANSTEGLNANTTGWFTLDTTAPTLSVVTPVSTPDTDTTPDLTFSSDEAGTITYGGSCSSLTTAAINGNNTITFDALTLGTYTDCTVTVTDTAGNPSVPLAVPSFTITNVSSSSGSSSQRSGGSVVPVIFSTGDLSEKEKNSGDLGGGERCSTDLILTQNLRPGARNGQFHSYTGEIVNEVKILQAHMNRLGFASGVEDGILGPITEGAIKRMQAYLGTDQDGYVGPVTRSLINNSCGEEDGVDETPAIPDREEPQCFISYTRLIKRGMTGDDVRQAQECIASLGHPTGPFDGMYGPLTYAGIRSYQEANNLILDGIIGPETAGHLNALSGVALDGVTSLN